MGNRSEDDNSCFLTGDFIFLTVIPFHIFDAEEVIVRMSLRDYDTKADITNIFMPVYVTSKLIFRYFN